MKRRAQTTPGAEAILAARKALAEEYPWAKEHQIRRLAILSVMRDNFEAQLAAGQNFDLDALLKLDDVIEQARSSIQKQEPIKVTVEFVDSTIKVANIVCKHCGQSGRYEIRDEPFDAPEPKPSQTGDGLSPAGVAPVANEAAEAEKTLADSGANDAAAANAAKPTADVVDLRPLMTRPGISPSAFHDQQLPSGEIPPLKRSQPDHWRTADQAQAPHPYVGREVAHPLPPVPRTDLR